MRLTAFVSAMTHSAMMSGVMPGVSETRPPRGTLNQYKVTPRKYRIDAARTCPATLAGADMSRASSMSPTTKMAAPASTTPSGSEDPTNTACSWRIAAATIIATRNPMNMAGPPP